MFNGEEFVRAKGVILTREDKGENLLWSTLFLEGEGIVSVSSKNFMGDSEPFVWGYFDLQRRKRSRYYFMFDTDIKDSMLKIRRGLEPLKTAFDVVRALLKYLPREHPDDELLVNLYWSMKLLTMPAVPPSAAYWRFLWLWLSEWGLAPEITAFHSDKGFTNEEVSLLSQLAILTYTGVIQLFTSKLDTTIRENIFRVASSIAITLLNEK